MVWESGCVVVVMLTPLSENGVRQCYHYWPDEGSNLYHIYEVLPRAPAGSLPSSESALPVPPASELDPAKGNRARTRLALAPRPFVLHSIGTSRFGGFLR